MSAALVPENDNAFDHNAVRVEIESCRVGYLPREMALVYRAALGEEVGRCSAKIVGGFELDDGSSAYFGVKLNLAWPPRLKTGIQTYCKHRDNLYRADRSDRWSKVKNRAHPAFSRVVDQPSSGGLARIERQIRRHTYSRFATLPDNAL